MTSKTKPAPQAPTPKQVELAICAAFYAGPAGHALLDKEDGDTMRMVVQRAREFREIFFEERA